MIPFLQKLRYGNRYGYEILFKKQDKRAAGKTGVLIGDLGMPEDYEVEFYSRFMEHVFHYTVPNFVTKMILVDKGTGLIDPDNPLAREAFKPAQLVDAHGSFTNRAGVPYVQCSYQWKPPNLKNPWDHGYFLYTGDGPNGIPDVCDKVGAKVVGWYYGKLIPEKKVAYRSQIRKIYDETVEQLARKQPDLVFRQIYYMDPEMVRNAVNELIGEGCQTLIFQNIGCPLYCDFEDYSHTLPMLHQFAAGRARVIMADQLGNYPAYPKAIQTILCDQLSQIPVGKSVLVILSTHGHPFKKETQDLRAPLYRKPLEEGVRRIMSGWQGKWEVVWSADEYADPFWDKTHTKFETYSAYRKAIDEGYDFALELPTEFSAENTDLMIFHAIKKFAAFAEYDRYAPVPYPDWEVPLVRKFTQGKTTGIYCGTPVGPYRKFVVQAAVDSISAVL